MVPREGGGVEVTYLTASEHHDLDPDCSFGEGVDEFLGGLEHGEGVLVPLDEEAELVAHFVQFVATQHVEIVAFTHEDA